MANGESEAPQVDTAWKSMRLRNFRGFEDTDWIQLPRITVLFGKNSSGKTTLLRAPLLFAQLLTTQSMLGDVPLAGPYVDFGSYRDLVRDADYKTDVELHFAFDLRPHYDRFFVQELSGAHSLFEQLQTPRVELRLHWNHPQARSQVSHIEVSDRDGTLLLSAERKGGRIRSVSIFLRCKSVARCTTFQS